MFRGRAEKIYQEDSTNMRKFHAYGKLLSAVCLLLSLLLIVCACGEDKTNEIETDSKENTTAANTGDVTVPTEEATTEAVPTDPTYKVTVLDENDFPLINAAVQLCQGELCMMPVPTDENGVATIVVFDKANYTAKITMDGYKGEKEYSFPEGSMELTVRLTNVTNYIGDNTTLTFTVPAGETVYYSGRMGGSTLKLTGNNAQLRYGTGLKTSANGEITMDIPVTGMFEATPMFVITNMGSAEETYTLSFLYPEGTMNNPKEIVMGNNTASVAADSEGYFFTWTATSAGTLTVTMTGSNWTMNHILCTKSHQTGCDAACDNEEHYIYSENYASNDTTVVTTHTVTVAAGDRVSITVGSADRNATEVIFTAAFAA